MHVDVKDLGCEAISEIVIGNIDPWRRDHCCVSKRRELITPWPGVVSRNIIVSYIAAVTLKLPTFNWCVLKGSAGLKYAVTDRVIAQGVSCWLLTAEVWVRFYDSLCGGLWWLKWYSERPVAVYFDFHILWWIQCFIFVFSVKFPWI
jgi:hypothetical protein